MGRFRLKQKAFSQGFVRVHEMRDPNTGRLFGQINLWADNRDVVPELIEAFLIGSELVSEDWREQLEIRDDQAKEDNAGPASV